MKKIIGLISIVAMMVVLFPLFTPKVHALESDVYYTGTIGWGPGDADPAVCYDTGSGELIFNVYQGLIEANGEKYYEFNPILSKNVPTRVDHFLTVTNASAVGEDPTGSTWTGIGGPYRCVGWVDEKADGFGAIDALFMTNETTWRTYQVDALTGTTSLVMNLWYGSYTFLLQSIDTTINFYDYTGAAVDTFDVVDAEYSFERDLVLDIPGQPVWMYDKPFFDLPDHSYFTNDTAIDLAHLIDDCIEGDVGTQTLTMNIGVRFPDNAFKQILVNTWGSIYSYSYVVGLGNWDGNLYDTTTYGGPFPDWWIDWAAEGAGIDQYSQDPLNVNAVGEVAPELYCGTGPYHVQSIVSASPNGDVVLQRNPGFWMGWPDPAERGYLSTINIRYISDWNTRKIAFQNGEIDVCAVPRAKMFELLDPVTKEPVDPKHKTIKQIIPPLAMDTNQFSFVARNVSVYMGTGVLPLGIPIDFFNNTHARKAMAYSFNWTTYGAQAYYGESDYRKNYLTLGLYPDYYNEDAAPGYYESLDKAEEELKNAYYVQDSVNKSLWEWGFYFDLTYNTGNDVRQIACQMISSFFDVLSTYDGRSGPDFTVFVKEITWTATIQGMVYMLLPMYDIGWLADFADADNFARTYMHSGGTFAYFSKYRATNGWGSEKDVIVDTAVLTDDSTPAGKAQRQALYDELAVMYYEDCPSFPVNEPRGRRFCQYWTKGWYYDALYPSQKYYTLWKEDDCWFDVSGTPVGISDGKLDMKDIAYLVLHFNAKAPVPGLPTDPRWVGIYGANGGVDGYGDRRSDMKDIAGSIKHFGHKAGDGNP